MIRSTIKSYKDLIVWQKAMNLVIDIYKLTKSFPKEELFVLTAQMRRCAISIPSNIAEGRQRRSRKEFYRFLNIAFSSASELETQLEIASRMEYISKDSRISLANDLEEILKILNTMISKLKI